MYSFKEIELPYGGVSVYGHTHDGRCIELSARVELKMWVRKSSIGLPDPTPLERELRKDAEWLTVHPDGSTEESPLHEWAEKPHFPLTRIIGTPWWDNAANHPPKGAGVWVSYKFFSKEGLLLAEVGVDSDTPMHIKHPEGTCHVIMTWGEKSHYFTKGEEESHYLTKGEEEVRGTRMSILNPEALRLARRKAFLTQETLASMAGISQPALAAYETGRQSPKGKTLHALAKALGVSTLSLTNLEE